MAEGKETALAQQRKKVIRRQKNCAIIYVNEQDLQEVTWYYNESPTERKAALENKSYIPLSIRKDLAVS